MAKHTKMPEEDWRALTIYQVMTGSFIHSEKGSDGYKEMWGPDIFVLTTTGNTAWWRM